MLDVPPSQPDLGDAAAESVLTGERTWPGIPSENYWFARHEACYRWASAVVSSEAVSSSVRHRPHSIRPGGTIVLDAGSGEGYGSECLRSIIHDAGVVAIDLDLQTMGHVRRGPGRGKLHLEGGGGITFVKTCVLETPPPSKVLTVFR